MTGALGAWLPALTSLEYLDVSLNQLSSTIPPLGSLTALRSFAADVNQLSGSLPSNWLASRSLREFDASRNRYVHTE